MLLELTAAAMMTVGLAAPSQDTVDVNRAVDGLIRQQRRDTRRLMNRQSRELRETGLLARDRRICSPDLNHGRCFFGITRTRCWENQECTAPTGRLVERLAQIGRDHPTVASPWVVLMHTLIASERTDEVLSHLTECAAPDGLCALLRGWAAMEAGDVMDAESFFREGLAESPDWLVCALTDATDLVGRLQRMELPEPREYSDPDTCPEILDESARIHWLADPLYVMPGNDRWAESIRRQLASSAQGRVGSTMTERDGAWRPGWVGWPARRGRWDSFNHDARTRWTSVPGARYHFVPDFGGEGLSQPTWNLNAGEFYEGYTPPYATFHSASVQHARFRAADSPSQMTAVAGTVAGTPVEDASTAYLVFTDAPESFPVVLESEFTEGRAVFLVEADRVPYVSSLEVVEEGEVGWHREMVYPLDDEDLGVSDILLYRPTGLSEPPSLMAATALMLPSTTVADSPEVGLYWEVYGVQEGEMIEYELELQTAAGGGFLQRIRRLLPGRDRTAADARIRWSEPSKGDVHSTPMIIEMESVVPGDYTVTLRARVGEREVVTTREVRVR